MTERTSDTEFDLLSRLREDVSSRFAGPRRGLVKGIGDDAAVVESSSGFDTVITTDLLVEGIDFKLDDSDSACAGGERVGQRAVAVSLSDVAAMGACPRWLLLSVGVPRKLWDQKFADALLSSAFEYALERGVMLVGGDISRTPEHVVVDSVVVGEVAHGRAVLRSGAKPGDLIYVTGYLGGAAHTLRASAAGQTWYCPLSGGATGARKVSKWAAANERSPVPQPRIVIGIGLGSGRLATAMIDISDGLSSDLAHLCRESKVGARIRANLLPLDPLLKRDKLDKEDALSLALHGGEDFELLFTVRPHRVRAVEKLRGLVPITRIGEITEDAGRIELIEGRRRRTLEPEGFDHFRPARR